ncbi:hypothetical protein [Nonomuraea dietziae]|uniref:hypothetical protein n=1 Tax=Nonomuraea dietziae TaxID=65515 RepID=UPI0031D26EA0
MRWLMDEDLGLDVASGGELAVRAQCRLPALSASPFIGNNKSAAELRRALEVGVGHVVVDSFEEIARLGYFAEQMDVRPRVMVRVTTGVEAHHARVHRDGARRPEVRPVAQTPARRARGQSAASWPFRSSSSSALHSPQSAPRSSTPREFEVAAPRGWPPFWCRSRTSTAWVLPRARPRRRLRHRLRRAVTSPPTSRSSPTRCARDRREGLHRVSGLAGAAPDRRAGQGDRRSWRRHALRGRTVKDVEGLQHATSASTAA